MKLKDVFKLDLKNKGQIKLFKNTINKYGIPTKEIKEIKENIKTDLIINPNKNIIAPLINIVVPIKFNVFFVF